MPAVFIIFMSGTFNDCGDGAPWWWIYSPQKYSLVVIRTRQISPIAIAIIATICL